ncbi:MAG: thiamine biosynthesis protein ApbE [Marinosulfonomonas sp.]|nr:FAD:protein FMN transferase [Marinosulfonomonas sp.]PHQ99370.1 MAG: thiamine biosynthesis protein ApbE [Marinosulfonomonas sp.]
MTTRRRVLTILAGAATLPFLGAKAQANVARWQGIALGARAQIVLDHPKADQLISMAVSEIIRLEGIFSLYQNDSQLSRLNRDGVLVDPAFEMIELFSICTGLHTRTKGAFDPTVQSLWALYAKEISASSTPTAQQISEALTVTGWGHVNYSASKVSFDRSGVMITLNGIAQGYIADKISALFRREGVENVLVNTGEISAVGHAPDGNAWQIKLNDTDGPNLALRNMSVATSSPLGTTFDDTGSTGHILDPRSGYPGGKWSKVSVVSHKAALADGLSTAFCLMNKAAINVAKEYEQVFLN